MNIWGYNEILCFEILYNGIEKLIFRFNFILNSFVIYWELCSGWCFFFFVNLLVL